MSTFTLLLPLQGTLCTRHCISWWVVDVCQVICCPCGHPHLCKPVCMRYESNICQILILSSMNKHCSFSKTSTDKWIRLCYALDATWFAHEWTILKPLAHMPLDQLGCWFSAESLALRASTESPALRAQALWAQRWESGHHAQCWEPGAESPVQAGSAPRAWCWQPSGSVLRIENLALRVIIWLLAQCRALSCQFNNQLQTLQSTDSYYLWWVSETSSLYIFLFYSMHPSNFQLHLSPTIDSQNWFKGGTLGHVATGE